MAPTLQPEEMAALLSAIRDRPAAAGSVPPASVVPYDLTGHDRIIRGQLPTLDAINERVASLFGAGLAGRTRQTVRVSSLPATLMKFADLSVLFAPPATLCVMSLGNGHGLALAAVEPHLADALLAAALGDRHPRRAPPSSEPRREHTNVERLVLRRLMTLLAEAMRSSWAEVLPLEPRVLRFESDPRLAAIAGPNDVVVLSCFELSEALPGRVQLAIPYAAVEPAKKLLAAPPRMSYGGDARFTAALAAELENVEVEIRASLGSTLIPLKALLALEPGEVILLPTSEQEPLTLYVEGRPKLAGMPMLSGGSIAVTLTRGLSPSAAPPRPPSPLPPSPPAPAPAADRERTSGAPA